MSLNFERESLKIMLIEKDMVKSLCSYELKKKYKKLKSVRLIIICRDNCERSFFYSFYTALV